MKKKKLILIIYSLILICSISKVQAGDNGNTKKNEIACIGNNISYDMTEITEINNKENIYLNELLNEQNKSQLIDAEAKPEKIKQAYKSMNGLKIIKRDSLNVSDEERKILYKIVEAEAGGENIAGKMLVANVIINRCEHDDFPDTIKEVVFANNGKTYQFSPISDGRFYTVKVSNETRKAVKKALAGMDNSQGAMYFMCRRLANSGNVSWFDRCLDKLFVYGCHEFYK